jgi:Rab3 GTPase-activating protein catalytic subunit
MMANIFYAVLKCGHLEFCSFIPIAYVLTMLTFSNQLRHCWEEGQPVPRLPVDSKPDLRYCLILQKLQAINCCIARQKRHYADLEFLDALNECMELSPPNNIQDIDSFFSLLKSRSSDTLRTKDILEPSKWFVELKTGQILLRLGADHPAGDLKMLETGQQVYSPITQACFM